MFIFLACDSLDIIFFLQACLHSSITGVSTSSLIFIPASRMDYCFDISTCPFNTYLLQQLIINSMVSLPCKGLQPSQWYLWDSAQILNGKLYVWPCSAIIDSLLKSRCCSFGCYDQSCIAEVPYLVSLHIPYIVLAGKIDFLSPESD